MSGRGVRAPKNAQFAGAGRLLSTVLTLFPTRPHSPSQSRDREGELVLCEANRSDEGSCELRHGARRLAQLCPEPYLQSCRGRRWAIRARRLHGACTTPAQRHVSGESFRVRLGLATQAASAWLKCRRAMLRRMPPAAPGVTEKLPPYPGVRRPVPPVPLQSDRSRTR